MKKTIYGVGTNDANYLVVNKGVRCPYYKKWSSMLERCFSKSLHKKHPTYIGCTVCNEWLLFSNFRSWMMKQEWVGMELDKDIISIGNKKYCPELCAFVDHQTNSLLRMRTKSLLPVGVSKCNKGGYIASIRVDNKKVYIGWYENIANAKKAYAERKAALINKLAKINNDHRIKSGLIDHAESLLQQK